jgi:hypothetical protein
MKVDWDEIGCRALRTFDHFLLGTPNHTAPWRMSIPLRRLRLRAPARWAASPSSPRAGSHTIVYDSMYSAHRQRYADATVHVTVSRTGRMSQAQAEEAGARPRNDRLWMLRMPICIEAVFEDIRVKGDLLRSLEKFCDPTLSSHPIRPRCRSRRSRAPACGRSRSWACISAFRPSS